jgi:hypothetical protein
MTASNRVVVEAEVAITGTVSPAAETQVETAIRAYAADLAVKIRQAEEDDRVAGVTNPEITASTVIKATERLKEASSKHLTSNSDRVLRLTVPISSGAAGVLGGYLHSALQAGLFGAAAAIAVVSTVLHFFRAGI